MKEDLNMSDKSPKLGIGFGKPLGGVILTLASLTGHAVEPIEQEHGTLMELKVQRSMDFVAYLPHGAEPLAGYSHTLQGVVRLATTSS
jgi:hypothetical protein